jgi:hypothetical protein
MRPACPKLLSFPEIRRPTRGRDEMVAGRVRSHLKKVSVRAHEARLEKLPIVADWESWGSL